MKQKQFILDPPIPFKEYPKTYENMFERRFNISKKQFLTRFGEDGEDLVVGGKKGPEAVKLALALLHKADKAVWDQAICSAYYLYHTKHKISGNKLYFPYIYGRSSEEYLKMDKKFAANAASIILKSQKGLMMNHSTLFLQDKFLYLWVYPTIGMETFDTKNPIDHPEAFAYPWKNVTLAHLMTVHKMDNREHLIDLAERENMNWFDFMDYVLNYILSVNEEAGEDVYSFVFKGTMFVPYINDLRAVKVFERVNKGNRGPKVSRVIQWGKDRKQV